MKIKDGPGWSPDGGYYIAKANVLYWKDGDVTDMNDKNLCIRLMPWFETESGNFSNKAHNRNEMLKLGKGRIF